MILDCLRRCLAQEPDMRIVGEPTAFESMIDAAVELKPDVLAIDLHSMESDIIDLMEEVSELLPSLRIVVCTSSEDRFTNDSLLNAGASQVVTKSEPLESLIRSIRGRATVPLPAMSNVPVSADGLTHNGHILSDDHAALARLTPREIEVLRLIGEGQSRLQIAEVIFRSPKTVDAHRGSIMDKIGVRDRAHLVRFAIRVGLVTP
ncbi:MAG: response regulator transcription factor [Phycisphaeraceae bacterium]|nr:response regulator transcription factor [Phycisphaeraceae bacterium]MCW5763360.1 response regulator transcription factor [Phycisphaeraceae bacterium]